MRHDRGAHRLHDLRDKCKCGELSGEIVRQKMAPMATGFESLRDYGINATCFEPERFAPQVGSTSRPYQWLCAASRSSFLFCSSSSHLTGLISPLVLHHLTPSTCLAFGCHQRARRGRLVGHRFRIIERSGFGSHLELSAVNVSIFFPSRIYAPQNQARKRNLAPIAPR